MKQRELKAGSEDERKSLDAPDSDLTEKSPQNM